ncbi:hypothetical protein N185_17095 [Sinorhizobium sp. GW3]|nr:hypothetical protein N185_17095 [Sinorhizobium sp. GW3]
MSSQVLSALAQNARWLASPASGDFNTGAKAMQSIFVNSATNYETRTNRSALRTPASGGIASLASTLGNDVAPLALIVVSGPALADSIDQNRAAEGHAPNSDNALCRAGGSVPQMRSKTFNVY